MTAAPTGPDLIEVVAVVLVDDLVAPTRLLTGRRTEPEFLAGGWELPGGKVDPGETGEQALHREVREEIGVEIVLGEQVPGPLPGAAWPLADRYRLRVWFAAIRSGDPRPLEGHDELRWLTAQAVWEVPWLETNRPVVEAAISRFRA